MPVVRSTSWRARAKRGRSNPEGRFPAVDSGLLRRLRRLAMTVPHYSPSLRARAKRARSNPESGRATRYASRPSHAAPPAWIASAASRPRNDGGRGGALAARPRLAAWAPVLAGPASVAPSHAQGRKAGSTGGLLLTSSKQRHFLTLTEP